MLATPLTPPTATADAGLAPIEPPKKLATLTIQAPAGAAASSAPVDAVEMKVEATVPDPIAAAVLPAPLAVATAAAPAQSPVKTEEAAVAAFGPSAASMQQLLQQIIAAEQRSPRGTVATAALPPPTVERTADGNVAVEQSLPAPHAGAGPAAQAPVPQSPALPTPDHSPVAYPSAAAGLPDSVATILQSLHQHAAQGTQVLPPQPPLARSGGAEPVSEAADAWQAPRTTPSAFADFSPEMQNMLLQITSGQAGGHHVGQPLAAAPHTQPASPMHMAALAHSAPVSMAYAAPLQQAQVSSLPRHDTTQEKNKRIQEEANLLVRSGLINRPAPAAVQPPLQPQQQQQPLQPQQQARGVQLSSQSVLAHYNLHQQQQLAQHIQQRQYEQAAAMVQQQLLQQQLRQRTQADAHLRFAHGGPAQLSESEIQFLHAAHANGTLRAMQLQHTQVPQVAHVSALQAQAQVHLPPQVQQRQHHPAQPDIHAIIRALQAQPEARPAAAQPLHRHTTAGAADARVSSAERIENLRRQVTAHLMAGGAGEGPVGAPGGATAVPGHRPEHRPTLSEQLMHDLALSIQSGAAGAAPGQHLANVHAADAARLLQQHARQAYQQQQMQAEVPIGHGGALFHPAQLARVWSGEGSHVGGAAAVSAGVPLQESHTAALRREGQTTPPSAALATSLASSSAAAPVCGSISAGHAQAGAAGAMASLAARANPGSAAGMGAAAAPAAGCEGGEHESETENLRSHDHPASHQGGCGSSVERGRTALGVQGDLLANGENTHAALMARRHGGSDGGEKGLPVHAGHGGADGEAGKGGAASPRGGGSTNENVRLLCNDRPAGADAQEGVLLEPAVS